MQGVRCQLSRNATTIRRKLDVPRSVYLPVEGGGGHPQLASSLSRLLKRRKGSYAMSLNISVSTSSKACTISSGVDLSLFNALET